jgi:hypothetical protein
VAGADLIVHDQFLAHLADCFADNFGIGASAHPRGTQNRTQKTVPQDVLQQVRAPAPGGQRVTKPTDFPSDLQRIFRYLIDQRSCVTIFAHRLLLD